MDIRLLIMTLLLGGSLQAMHTPAGQYFLGWDSIPTYIDPDDMNSAIGHGLWLAQQLDKAQAELARLRAERDKACDSSEKYNELLIKACAKIKEQKDQLALLKKRKKRGLKTIKKKPEELEESF